MLKMKLSTVLLSSAALLVAGAAYAADLPAKKAAPAAAPTGCPAFGAGFFQIPGGDTCIKISGMVRYKGKALTSGVSRGAATITNDYAYDVNVETRQNTDMGTLTAYAGGFTGGNDPLFYINFAGFTAGLYDGLWDNSIGGINSGFYGPYDTGLMYQASVGSVTMSIAETAPVTNYGNTTVLPSRPDVQAQIKAILGSSKIEGTLVNHEADGSSSGTGQGYAAKARVDIGLDPATIKLYAAYASGATAYLTNSATTGITDASSDSSSLATGSNVGAGLAFAVSKVGTLYGWVNQTNISDASSNSYKATNVGVYYQHTVVPGLIVRPEFYQAQETKNSAATTTQGVYLRIQRDF
jgi:hypothetical protein